MSVEWSVALRYLRPRRAERFLSVIALFSTLGIAVGVATLVVVLAVMNGFPTVLVQRVTAVVGDMVVFGLEDAAAPARLDAFARIAGVDRALPMREGDALAYSRTGAAGVRIQGVRPTDLVYRRAIAAALGDSGARTGFGQDESAVLLGARLAERLGLAPGDTLALVSSEGRPSAFGTLPRQKRFRVAGVLDLGIHEYDRSFVLMPYDTAARFLGDAGSEAIAIWLAPGADPRAVASALARVAAPARVVDWAPVLLQRFDFVRVQRNAVVLILSLIVIVGALNIVSGLNMLIAEKARGIAILRTMGASPATIRGIFVRAGAIVSLCGTVLGVVLGVLLARNIEAVRQAIGALVRIDLFSSEIYSLSAVPALLRPLDLGLVALGALVVAVLATLPASRRAARLDPAALLRHG